MIFQIRCPSCGHHKMHYGEIVIMAGQKRTDAFSCRNCASGWDAEELKEIAQEYLDAIMRVETGEAT